MGLKVQFLGTGTSQGVPVIACKCAVCQSTEQKDKRLRSSVLISVDGKNILIDCGPDFREQMLRSKTQTLDAILFTHEHRDHIAGLDDVRSYNYLSKKPMDVYAEEKVCKALKLQYAYVFAENKYPGIPQVKMHTITTEPFKIGNTEITPIRVMHYRLPILGYRINSFAYITDAKHISKNEMGKLKNLDVLVINGIRKQEHISHFSIYQALEVIKGLHPKKAYITHISHFLGKHHEIERELPENVFLAFDELHFNLF